MKSKLSASHNFSIQECAREYAREMQNNPSPLEERMMELLDRYKIPYTFQKIFYITEEDGSITKFFIADFYFPELNIILETDGKFHKKQAKKDAKRTELIIAHYPQIKIIRWEFKDFDDKDKVKQLVRKLRHGGKLKQAI